jgi:hypothetical protein
MRFGDAIWRSFRPDTMSAVFIPLGFLTKWGEMLSAVGSSDQRKGADWNERDGLSCERNLGNYSTLYWILRERM